MERVACYGGARGEREEKARQYGHVVVHNELLEERKPGHEGEETRNRRFFSSGTMCSGDNAFETGLASDRS